MRSFTFSFRAQKKNGASQHFDVAHPSSECVVHSAAAPVKIRVAPIYLGDVTQPAAGAMPRATVTGEIGAVHQGRSSRQLQAEFPELRKRYWGQHMWARGYFCATMGAVDEATIKAYIGNQAWEEDDQGFKITAPTEP